MFLTNQNKEGTLRSTKSSNLKTRYCSFNSRRYVQIDQ